MKYFLLFYDVVEGYLEKRAPYREQHLALVKAAYERGEIVLAGAYGEPPCAATLLFRVATSDDVRAFALADPYVINGVVTKWEVQPWHVVVGEETGGYVDLSHEIENGMVTYQGLPAPLICDHLSRLQSRAMYQADTEFQIGRIEMVGNTGTYLDTPYHRYADGYDLAALPIERVSGVPGVVVRVTDAPQRAIDWQRFAGIPVRGRAVLINTGWDRHWRTDRYFEEHPYVTQAAAEYLRDEGALLVGIDSMNIDDTSGGDRPVHSTLLAAGIPIVEHLTNLSALPAKGFHFSAVPPKIAAMGTFPVRAHARLGQR